jgi:small subunit ribosomal protein S15
MLTKKQKDAIIKKFKIHESDTGSATVQIALLTKEIEMITTHLKRHKKDFSSRRGLIKKVSQRRRLLKFLRQDSAEQFEQIIKKLNLRRPAEFSAVEEDIKQEEDLMAKKEEEVEEEALEETV